MPWKTWHRVSTTSLSVKVQREEKWEVYSVMILWPSKRSRILQKGSCMLQKHNWSSVALSLTSLSQTPFHISVAVIQGTFFLWQAYNSLALATVNKYKYS
jgi:hypothetical protein